MAIWIDNPGTSLSYFRVGLTGPRLKDVSGVLTVRNAGDSADAQLTVSKINISGDSFDLNSDAAGTGADWKITFARPTSGMTAHVNYTLPVDDGTPSQVLSTDGSGVLSWISASSTASCVKMKTTTLGFGSASPVTLMSTGAGDIIEKIQIIIDTAFNGTPSVSIGISGTTSKYMPSTAVDLTQVATTIFEYHPGLAAQGAESLIATYAANSASAGSARIIIFYGTPA